MGKPCEYCGQYVNSDEGEGWQHCNCDAARMRQKKEDQLIMAYEHIDELFGEEGLECYGYPPVSSAHLQLLKQCASLAVASGLRASVTFGNVLGSAKISTGSKGQIKISRSLPRGMTLETE